MTFRKYCLSFAQIWNGNQANVVNLALKPIFVPSTVRADVHEVAGQSRGDSIQDSIFLTL